MVLTTWKHMPSSKAGNTMTFLSIAVMYDLEMHQMDVKSAFLAGDFDEVIYMDQPEEFIVEGDLVCKLLKSLYNLKQAPCQWNNKIHHFLVSIGFI